MSEWPKVCTALIHHDNAKSATGHYADSLGHRVWFCQACAIRLGSIYKAQGYKWEPLREPSPAPPTSERVQP